MKSHHFNYALLCLVSLLILLMSLVERGLFPWALLPVAVGGLAVLARWRMGNGLMLGSLCGILLIDAVHSMVAGAWFALPPFHPSDVLVAGSALAFVVGNTRLLSLTRNILPRDPRRDEWLKIELERAALHKSPDDRSERPRQAPIERLPSGAGTGRELIRLLLTLPIWIILGQLVWFWLSYRETDLPINRDLWRLLWVFTGGSLVLILAHMLFSQWRLRTMSQPEAHMILQDAQWLETRNEQRLIARWLAWAKTRLRRRSDS